MGGTVGRPSDGKAPVRSGIAARCEVAFGDTRAMLTLAAAAVDDFYKTVSTISFTLLGLWWIVIQLKYKEGGGDARRRRHAYTVSLYFLLPGVMALVSAINSDLSLLWRLAFGITALLGMAEVVLYATTDGIKTRGASGLRILGVALYALIAAFAIRPALTGDLGLGLAPREAEAILVGLLIVVGVHLAWFGVTESHETAGA